MLIKTSVQRFFIILQTIKTTYGVIKYIVFNFRAFIRKKMFLNR